LRSLFVRGRASSFLLFSTSQRLRNKTKQQQKTPKSSASTYVPLNRQQRERGAALLRDAAERGWLLSTVDPDAIRPLEDDEFKLVSRY
jgi:hypothetical protein